MASDPDYVIPAHRGGGWFIAGWRAGNQQSLPPGALHILPDERVDPLEETTGLFGNWASSV